MAASGTGTRTGLGPVSRHQAAPAWEGALRSGLWLLTLGGRHCSEFRPQATTTVTEFHCN